MGGEVFQKVLDARSPVSSGVAFVQWVPWFQPGVTTVNRADHIAVGEPGVHGGGVFSRSLQEARE